MITSLARAFAFLKSLMHAISKEDLVTRWAFLFLLTRLHRRLTVAAQQLAPS